MLGKTVYFIDMKKRKVGEGVVLSSIISQTGYIVHIIISCGEKKNVESALVFLNKEEAEKRLPDVLKIKDDMDYQMEEFERFLDIKRELVIGKPEFKELAHEYFKN